MYALPEGTVCYPHVQMVRIECDLVGAILIETYLLQTMNFHSLIATKATRVTGLNTHTPRSVMEFGTSRAQGESAGNDGAYAAVLGGCVGTANCLAEMKFGSDVKAVGTVAHSFIEFFPTEFDAFKAFADTYPDSVSLLLDTYNIMESGLPNLIKLDDYLIEKYPNDPNRRVKKGDKFGYDYNIRSYIAKAWLQNQITTTHWDVNYGLEMSYTNFMRHGNMRNGRAPENSYGAGKRHTFDNAALKAGATYKINGRNYITAHASYGTRAPLPDQAYVSPRIKDTSVTGLKSERYLSGDISYGWNYTSFRGQITGFWTEMYDGLQKTAFYDDQYSTFMNYVMSGIRTSYKGVELGMMYKITPALSISAAATYSRYQYKNRPTGTRSYENGAAPDVTTTVYLKNYYVGGTPQQAYSLGIDWAAPGMWFFNLNANWMGDSYVDLAPIRHEAMPDLWQAVETQGELDAKIKEITTQEKLKDAFVMNFSVGKVIYTRWGSININVSVNNLLNNRNIMTGGYQQGRFDYDNYNVGKFPNKYYYAQGIRVFANFGIRF